MPEDQSSEKYEIIPWEVATEVPGEFAASVPQWLDLVETELEAEAKSKSGAVDAELEKMNVDFSHPESILLVAIFNVKIPLHVDIPSMPVKP